MRDPSRSVPPWTSPEMQALEDGYTGEGASPRAFNAVRDVRQKLFDMETKEEVLQFSRYVAMAIFDRYKLFGGAAGNVRSRVLAVLASTLACAASLPRARAAGALAAAWRWSGCAVGCTWRRRMRLPRRRGCQHPPRQVGVGVSS